MKNVLLFSVFAFILSNAFSQIQTNTFPASGNVGIGTLNPQTPLHVIGDATISGSIVTSQVLITDKVQTDTIKGSSLTLGTSSVVALPIKNCLLAEMLK